MTYEGTTQLQHVKKSCRQLLCHTDESIHVSITGVMAVVSRQEKLEAYL